MYRLKEGNAFDFGRGTVLGSDEVLAVEQYDFTETTGAFYCATPFSKGGAVRETQERGLFLVG